MCGIFALLNNTDSDIEAIKAEFMKGKNRGPENSQFLNLTNINTILGFHRLPINGYQDDNANQPFHINNKYLICNGEIYNFKQLYDILGDVNPYSGSDCEIIIHLYEKFGIDQTLQVIDGVFAFILIDIDTNKIFVARDTYGVRPLFAATVSNPVDDVSTYYFSSELKSICNLSSINGGNLHQFEPGCYSVFNLDHKNRAHYVDSREFSSPNSFFNITTTSMNHDSILKNIYTHIENAVMKRVDNTEREVACLLSGGLDSSIVCALVKRFHKGPLHTWSIGFEGSEDLKYAQKVADHIGSIHHSICVSEKEFLDAIPEVIYAIESYDTTTVRASVGNWLISKYIKQNSDAKVIFNGDGADEAMGGYMYFHLSGNCIEFDRECRRLLSNIHYYDVLRSDRSISSHGLEARTPFLDRKFIQYYLSIDPSIRFHPGNNQCEKYLMRKAVETYGNDLLPESVLWRTKEAFSDGVSKQTKSWYEIIQDYVRSDVYSHYQDEIDKITTQYNPYTFNRPTTLEQLYYRDIFHRYFSNLSLAKVIPYFWMPKYCDATDASARTLQVYKDKMTEDEVTVSEM